MVFSGVRLFRSPIWWPSGGWRHARGREHCRGEPGSTRGHSATCGLLVGILQWKVSEFRFGGLISASYKLSARKLNQITSLRSIFGTISRDTCKYVK